MGASTERTDSELVLAAREGSQEAFSHLVTRYMRPAFLMAVSIVGNREDAEDAAQEAFVAALERLEECRKPESFRAWFLTIVRNRARNIVRRERVRAGERLPAGLPDEGGDPLRSAERGELRARLVEALERIPPVEREIVLLHDLEGWKHREIAEALGLPSGTVRSHLHRARKKLRAILGLPEAEEEGVVP